MSKTDILNRIAKMKRATTPSDIQIWIDSKGKWHHHRDALREWDTYEGASTDLKFTKEWYTRVDR